MRKTTCLPLIYQHIINDGREFPNGVPNYDQESFQPGRGDCAPVATAMVLGYWDANGWSQLFRGSGPYTGGQTPHPSIDNAVEQLKHAMGFSWTNSSTYHLPGVADWGPAVKEYVRAQDSGANWITWDAYVDFDADIKDEVRADRPLVFSIMGVPGKQLTWDSPSGSITPHAKVDHSLTAIGYRQVVKSTEIWPFGCVDWVNPDDRFVVMRSGWRNGGDSVIYYLWGFWDIKTRLTIRPGGTASGVDWRRAYFFKGNQYSRWDMETNQLDQNYPVDITAWPGVPSNLDAALNLGNGKVHFFKGNQVWRYDLSADRVESGYPAAISSEWAGIPTQLDAAVRVNLDNGKVYFFKGSQVWQWDIASARLDGGFPRSIATEFIGVWSSDIDAVVNWGNGKLFFFKGSECLRYDIVRRKVDSGYPRLISAAWKGLFSSSLDAALSFESQFSAVGRVSAEQARYYSVDLGTTPRTLQIQMTGSGDADIYVRRTSRPTTSVWECRPYTSTSNESCTLNNVTGRVHVMVRGFLSSSDFQISAVWAN